MSEPKGKIHMEIPWALKQRLEAYAAAAGQAQTAVVIAALEAWLAREGEQK